MENLFYVLDLSKHVKSPTSHNKTNQDAVTGKNWHFNRFMPNGISRPYELAQSISVLRVIE